MLTAKGAFTDKHANADSGGRADRVGHRAVVRALDAEDRDTVGGSVDGFAL